eukprot:Sspe_Gene.109913::Locus_90153_Transcript_1_1_Confidence_1.000_Length_417::g.109913::m.109913
MADPPLELESKLTSRNTSGVFGSLWTARDKRDGGKVVVRVLQTDDLEGVESKLAEVFTHQFPGVLHATGSHRGPEGEIWITYPFVDLIPHEDRHVQQMAG